MLPFARVSAELRTWDLEVSDCSNCFDVSNPRLVHAQFDPLGDVPAYVPLKALRDAGWDPRNGLVIHNAESPKVLDHRNSSSHVLYFQTLLQLPDLLTVNPEIRSDGPQTYFALVLQRVKVEPRQTAATYRKQLLAICSGRDVPRHLAIEAAPKEEEVSEPIEYFGDFAIAGLAPAGRGVRPTGVRGRQPKAKPKPKLGPIVPPAICDKAASDASDSSSSGSGSSSSSSSSSDDDSEQSFQIAGMDKRSIVSSWYTMPNGAKIKVERYKPKGKRAYQRLVCKCGIHGDGCEKKRGTSHSKNFGQLEPIAFCCAWSDHGSGCSRKEHTSRHFRVPLDAVRGWMDRMGPEADKLASEF